MADVSAASSPAIAEQKATLRKDMLARRTALSPAVRAAAPGLLAGHGIMVWQSTGLAAGAVVAGYVAQRGEIDPEPLLAGLAARGARLALPRVDGEALDFLLHEPGEALVTGRFGLKEPAVTAPRAEPDVLLVPLLAFDAGGHRLGYGKGFYDRALEALPRALTIGIAFAAQEVGQVPVESHDRWLDFVLTEQGLIDCRAARGQ